MKLFGKINELVKKMGRKNIILIAVCVVVAIVLIWYGFNENSQTNPDNNLVNKGQIAKSIALLFHSMEEIESLEEDHFPSEEEAWYEKYMNMMYSDTYFGIKDIPPTEKEALSSFTYGDLEKLYTNIGVVDEELLSYVKNNKMAIPIKLEDWSSIYGKMVEKLDTGKNVAKINLILSGTISRDPSLPQWMAATTYGHLGFEGLSVDYYIDKGITVLIRDEEIINVLDMYSENVTYSNCWIISMSSGNVRAYVEGCIREFISTDKTSAYNNVVADLIIEDNNLVETKIKSQTVSGKVLASSKDAIEIESVGNYDIDENCRVYKIYGNIQMCSISEVLVGYDAQKFVVNDDGKICAIVIDRDVQASNIRVLLKTTGFKDMYHDYITITTEDGCTITNGNGEVLEIEAGKEYTISTDSDIVKLGRIKISPKGVDRKVGISSIKRGYGVPYYRGTLEVVLRDGRLIVINELPLEEYLYSVVPSEMPWNYNYEALKAQAICARSFAYIHIMNNSYSEYGAHVDDSTTYQVYNNSEEQTVSNAAVDETYGQVLMHGSNVISAYFYSTSCGSTTSSGAVWGSELPYTAGRLLSDEENNMNLMDEPTFDAFIRTNYNTFDSDYPWYRWKVTFSLKELADSINSQLGTIKAENVQILDDKGQWVNKQVSSVGQVKKIEVGERGQGGVLTYVTIFGTEGTVRVYKEYNIRKIFSPDGIAVKRGIGDEVTAMSMLPSGFFVLDEVTENNLLSGYTFVGGGYGHGVGMSQNGANTMAKLGKNCQEILTFFYKDATIAKKY